MDDDETESEHLDPTEPVRPDSPDLPERVGPYRILERLGEGGMGIVYLAEQTEPVRRRVALKVIKHGMDTKRVVARFEAERQALAMMDHPCVAKVYDAGSTEGGRPYFAMEYVQGVPITEHCDRQRLTTRERLELFQQVCEGVQHAHQNAIIHRDLKPSNVLVSYQGDKTMPKIIDFGVAKAIRHRLTEKTVYTEMGVLIGTLEYMSPEQAEMTGQNVDTRTDVYSLGVMLYELLVGALPFESKELRQAGFDEIRRKIRVQEPSQPSKRLSTLESERSTESAQRRKTDPSTLRRQLSGDLDWITMRALEKDRARRYGSPSELAADVDRHLTSRPILARPPSTVYRLRKFAQRNKVLVGGVAATFLALIAGVVVSTVQRQEAIRQRDEANQQKYFANILGVESSLRLGEVSRAKRRLSLCPPNFRNWEWFYLSKMADQSTATLRGHEGAVKAVAFSPDGTRVVTGSTQDRTLRLWDAATGELLTILTGDEAGVASVAFSPDGARIASGSVDTVRLWDAVSGEPLTILPGHEGVVLSVAFSPDGKRILSVSDDRTLRLWGVASGELLERREGSVVAFSPDGTHVASVSADKTILLWDLASGELMETLTGDGGGVVLSGPLRDAISAGEVRGIAVSPDTTHVASVMGSGSGSIYYDIGVWDVASGELVTTLTGHVDGVFSLAFSPDGRSIASSSYDKTIRLWELPSDSDLARPGRHEFRSGLVLRGHEHGVGAVAFSPDGERLVSGSMDNTARLWDAASVEPAILTGHQHNHVPSVAFSPDGSRLVSASGDRTLRLWDGESGEPIGILAGHDKEATSAAFSPDGTRIASGSFDRTIRLWDAASGEVLETLTGHDSGVWSVAFSPDGTRIASASHDKTVRLWDALSGELLETLTGHEDEVRSVAFSPDGTRIVSGSYDKTARVWDAATGAPLETLAIDEGQVRSVAFSPDGTRIATGYVDGAVRLWDAASGAPLETLAGHEGQVLSIAFSPDGSRIVTGGGEGRMLLWDGASGEPLTTLTTYDSGMEAVYSVAFSPDGSRIASSHRDFTVRLWSGGADRQREQVTHRSVDKQREWYVANIVAAEAALRQGDFALARRRLSNCLPSTRDREWFDLEARADRSLAKLTGHDKDVYSVDFSPDGRRIVSGSEDKTVRLWDAVSGGLLETLKGHEKQVYTVAFSPDGKRIVSSSADRTVRLWDAASSKLLRILQGHTDEVGAAVFSPDGTRVASASDDATVRLWDAASGEPLNTLTGHEDWANAVAFSPDGSLIASGSRDKTVRIWDAVSGEPLATLTGHDGWVWDVAFSPDGARIASASTDDTVRLWDAASHEPLTTLEGHKGAVERLAFSPDGTRIASGSDDGTVRLWDAVSGELLTTLVGHWGTVFGVTFSPDGTRIASGSADDTVRLW